jgi:hypothetical protein
MDFVNRKEYKSLCELVKITLSGEVTENALNVYEFLLMRDSPILTAGGEEIDITEIPPFKIGMYRLNLTLSLELSNKLYKMTEKGNHGRAANTVRKAYGVLVSYCLGKLSNRL